MGALPNAASSLLLGALLGALVLLASVEASAKPKDKHCKDATPADDGYLSHCSGVIRCPESCPDCHLSCKFCGMAECPKCNKVGSVCQDPRFIGGDGVMFYFHGYKDADFCIMSDSGLHINAHFIGKRTAGRPRDFTWVQALGILFDTHKLYIGANRVANWKPEVDQFVIYLDGSAISIPLGEGEKWVSASKDMTLTRTEDANSLNLEISGLLNSSVSIIPITKEESRVHNYEITDTDCFAHLEVNFDFLKLTDSAAGVLGQTYSPSFVNPVKRDVPMPIMGGEQKYVSSSVLTPDCAVAKFRAVHHTEMMDSRAVVREHSVDFEMPNHVQCGSSGADGLGFVCRK